MSDMQKAAIEAAADRLHAVFGYGGDHCYALAEEAVLAAEEAWPHTPPKRDPASTIAAGMNLVPQLKPYNRHRQQQPMRPAPDCFGFGPPGVSA